MLKVDNFTNCSYHVFIKLNTSFEMVDALQVNLPLSAKSQLIKMYIDYALPCIR